MSDNCKVFLLCKVSRGFKNILLILYINMITNSINFFEKESCYVHTWCRRGCSLASQEKRSLWSPPLPGDHQRSSLLWISNIIMKSYTKVNKHSWTTKCKRDSPMRFSIPSFFINQTHFGRYFLVQVWSIDEKNCRSKISSDCPSMLYLLVTCSFLLKSACVHQNS